jgi:8-oxo-dGTP diphosphatase
MNIEYILEDKELEFFVGKLKNDVTLVEEKNKLCWVDINSEFYDTDAFAGDGNIWHIVKYAELNKNFEKK